jgi:hypothetical protein
MSRADSLCAATAQCERPEQEIRPVEMEIEDG